MKIISNPQELKYYLNDNNKTIGYVPTMGALHKGHISLINEARKNNEIVIVSIFLNPTQFSKDEDLDKYPKKDEADKKICELLGTDILFFPSACDIYTKDEVSILAPNIRGFVLEGQTRPSHFNGVLTVVMKLLNIVNPTRAYFGKKDAQQLNLITLMVKQFFMDVEIVPIDTVREIDGLAMSSRNIYLNDEQRLEALKISFSLSLGVKMVLKNILDVKEITNKIREYLEPMKICYVEILNRDFEPITKVEITNSIILLEVRIGKTRLLDNIWI
jgi:pantoate--beta-alanine ligase